MLWKGAEVTSLTVNEILTGTVWAIEEKVDQLMEELEFRIHTACEDWRKIVRQQGYL